MDINTFQPIHLAYQQSNLSIRAFCQEYGIPAHTFYYWQKQLTTHPLSQTEFIEVRSREIDSTQSDYPTASTSPALLKLFLGNASLHLEDGFSKQSLVHCLQALREANLC